MSSSAPSPACQESTFVGLNKQKRSLSVNLQGQACPAVRPLLAQTPFALLSTVHSRAALLSLLKPPLPYSPQSMPEPLLSLCSNPRLAHSSHFMPELLFSPCSNLVPSPCSNPPYSTQFMLEPLLSNPRLCIPRRPTVTAPSHRKRTTCKNDMHQWLHTSLGALRLRMCALASSDHHRHHYYYHQTTTTTTTTTTIRTSIYLGTLRPPMRALASSDHHHHHHQNKDLSRRAQTAHMSRGQGLPWHAQTTHPSRRTQTAHVCPGTRRLRKHQGALRLRMCVLARADCANI
eukprot:1161760-Pelagomonas_calceolata.AAC.9